MESFLKVKDSSLSERLQVLDKEIAALRLKCKKAGCDAGNVRDITLPLVKVVQRGCWKIRVKRFAACILFLGFIIGISQWDVSNKAISVVYRKMMVNYVLPHYDWTWVWNDECFLSNPYYGTEESTQDEDYCAACQHLRNLTFLRDVEMEVMSDAIFRMEPTIITDAMQEWPSTIQPVSLDGIMQMYVDLTDLQDEDSVSNLRFTDGLTVDNYTVRDLYKAVEKERSTGRPANFTAYWANSNKMSSREIHKLYHQPYFLPGMCEPARDKNFVLLGKNSQIRSKALMFDPVYEEKGFWIGQLLGVMEIVLQPTTVCRVVCENIKFLLKEGQILNMPNRNLFEIAFRPGSDEAVAIAVGYTYD